MTQYLRKIGSVRSSMKAGLRSSIPRATAVFLGLVNQGRKAPCDGAYEYAVRVYELERARTLVAAIEIVIRVNKDRRQNRTAFVAKCAEMIRRGVAVSVIDLVTVKQFNLYAELMAFQGHLPRTRCLPTSRRPAPPRADRWNGV